MGKFDGQVAFITGVARGQGRSHAIRLAQEGADIIGVDICRQIDTVAYPLATFEDLEETKTVVEKHGRVAAFEVADVRDLGALRTAFDAGIGQLGRVDIVIANAGIMPTVGARADDDEAFYDAIDVMLKGVWHTLRVSVPKLIEQQQGGGIVITSSTAGLKGLSTACEAGSDGYAAAKHAVVGLMRVYANRLAKHRIRVNTVHPTGVNSPMIANDAFAAFTVEHPEVASALQNSLPVDLIECEDISNAIAWLASTEGRYVTGVTLPVDAGFTSR
ncbi:mycofactocin-coupled SDR family oxidoreductase [Mycobacterium sp. CVI_P3]|uniref:Mycofactocin-coupled SDR family oxidoreductase n=1 Tax=Mycobacterium pinniadriaticum TaxID=2994102 RepID=A0ABT3SG45_9MYCO|nr:mycofactocin-coupled SDR family oxidoreductase [Mycobacterium pinniadriaticum]MCX2931812.1 mycofactocin-coupled SDR family oxidoreductase [Mycobacterium pinniadriaticum]MCX2938113.1 mycofactocin-coupled SDR family oxidoreductase [Mycobacterium pinniadriaticum]